MGTRKLKTITADAPADKAGKKLSAAPPAAKAMGGKKSASGGKATKPPVPPIPPSPPQPPKTSSDEGEKALKKSAKKARKALAPKKRGRHYQAVKGKVEEGKSYPLSEAVKLVKETSYAKFDASVEAHINLGLDAGQDGQQVRTTVVLPRGTGKSTRVLVFAGGKAGEAALSAGADKVGDEATIGKIAASGEVAFDAIVATPEFMPKLAKLGRILGPQGLMPSPKAGTVTDKPAEVVGQLKKGRVELRTKGQPIIHAVIGRVSSPDEHLVENFKALLEELNRVKPSKTKGQFIKSIFLTSTMGPSVRVDGGELT